MDAPAVTRPVALPQFLLEYFTGAALGQRIEELDRLGYLEARQDRPAIFDQFFFGNSLARLEDNERFGHLAPPIIGHSNNCALQNERVGIDCLFDFDGRDVLAARYDDVLLAVDDQEIALLINQSHVAGVQPAAAQSLSGFFGALPIARHDIIGAHYNLA